MDKAAVSSLIRSLLDGTTPLAPAQQEQVSNTHADARKILVLHFQAERLKALLSTQPEFFEGRGYILQHGDAGTGFHCDRAAELLLRFVEDGGTAEAAVQWIENLLRTPAADCLHITSLWGVTVSATIELANDFSLVPFHELPESKTKDWIYECASAVISNPLVPRFFTDTPPAALVKRFSAAPFVTADDGLFRVPKKGIADEANEIRLALSCIGPSAPTVAVIWTQFLNPEIARAMRGFVNLQPVDVVPAIHHQPTHLTAVDSASIVNAYIKTSGKLRGKLDVALGRLNRAVRQQRMEDQVLDIAIALEVLLTDNNPGEHTYKVSLRAGLLDSGTPEKRLRSRAIAGALYTLRNNVVHGSHVPEKSEFRGKGKRPSHEIVNEALQLVGSLTRCLILRGNLPDWYTYEL